MAGQSVNDLNNLAQFKQTVSLRTLPIGEPQRILELRAIDTQYGRAVIAELDDVNVFLPHRMPSSA